MNQRLLRVPSATRLMMLVCLVCLMGCPLSVFASSTLDRLELAYKINQPPVPADQRLQGSLVSPLWLSTKVTKRVASVAGLEQGEASVPGQSLKPNLAPSGTNATTRARTNEQLHKEWRRIAEKKSAEELKEERRAAMASWHQILGFSTLALLAATVVVGQINAVDFLDGRLSGQPMIWAHRVLAVGTGTSYLATGILGWMFPFMREKDDDDDSDGGFDSSKWHGALAWVHGIGMLLLNFGGIFNAHLIPSDTDAKIAFTVSHLALGYITLAALAAAAILISFF